MAGSFKVYLHLSDGSVEVRRFGVPSEQATNFAALIGKLSNIFPALSGKDFTVYYHDDENEKVVIGSDEELDIALHVMTSKDPYRLHLKVGPEVLLPQPGSTQLKAAEGELHSHVTCDGCDGPVRGYRYKCMECPDYDLCAACEMKAFHPGHKMMRVPIPSMMPPYCPYMKRQGPRVPPKWGGKCGRFYRPFQMEMPGFVPANTEESEVPPAEDSAKDPKHFNSAEYLKNIGQAVTSMLDVLGIDVDLELIPPQTKSSMEESRGASAEPQQPEAQNQDQPMPEVRRPTPEHDIRNIFAPGLFGWTLVNTDQQKQEREAEKNSAASSPDETRQQTSKSREKPEIKPSAPSPMTAEERTAVALERMCEMGFTNEGNWLGQLLLMKNGSIDAVLELLNPKK